MHISKVVLRNYRNFTNSTFKFLKGVNTIIGENGSGKTNALRAIRLLIDDSMPRATRFYENDFNRALENWKGHWIAICIEFDELDFAEEMEAILQHATGEMDGGRKGRYNLYIRPKIEIRRRLFEYAQEDTKDAAGLKSILDEITLDDYEAVYRGRGTVDFSDDDQYKQYVGNFESITFPNPDDLEEGVYGWPMSNISIPNEVSCTFVQALRDVEAELRSYNNPLVNLLRGKEKDIPIANKQDIESKVETLNNDISELDEVKKVSVGIGNSIKNAVGETYAPNIAIKSELPNDMERLLQSLNLWVGDPDDEGYQGKIWELSLGGANLVYLSLKLLEYQQVKSTNRLANFLVIEEPEAHIHTHIQKTLFEKIEDDQTQVIISTHSTHISSVSKISSVNILSRDSQKAIVFQPSNELNGDQVNRLERYLDAVRSTLLFAKGVVLVEGDAEQIMIPAMFSSAFGISLDEIGISLINIGSTGFENVASVFHEDRIRRNCAIVTDLDSSLITLSDNPDDDSDEQTASRNSQTSGLDRQNLLNSYCSENSFLNPYYATWTFEIDFINAGNTNSVIKCLDKIYTQKASIDSSAELLESAEIETSGKETLRLANKVGKGWFALLMAEQLDAGIKIPEYILKAITHASSHIKQSTFVKISLYRIDMAIKQDLAQKEAFETLKSQFEEIDQTTAWEVGWLTSYRTTLPDDMLTKFMEYIENGGTA